MTNSDDWAALINDALRVKSGDIPIEMEQNPNELGTVNSSINAGCNDISPESPKSPPEKQGKGESITLDAGPGNGFGQLNCDKNHEWMTLVKASSMGYECERCDHLHMQVFTRVKDRRLFHWRCNKGFVILETQYAGERVHIAPPDCDQYSP